jgi:hypothetical protein
LVLVATGIEDLFDFPLFFVIDDDWRRRRLRMSGDWFAVVFDWLEERDVEDRMDLDGGREVQFIGFGSDFFQDGVSGVITADSALARDFSALR